jgi:hypothetical protein
MLILSNYNIYSKLQFTKIKKINYKINFGKFTNKYTPKIVFFQNNKYSISLFFFKTNFKIGTLRHSTIGVFNKIFFPHSSKKKNLKNLIKILYFFIKDTINYIHERLLVLCKNNFDKKLKLNNLFIHKLYLNDTFNLFCIYNNKKLLRLKKKKRSLQRKSRKKVFTSKFGRI